MFRFVVLPCFDLGLTVPMCLCTCVHKDARAVPTVDRGSNCMHACVHVIPCIHCSMQAVYLHVLSQCCGFQIPCGQQNL